MTVVDAVVTLTRYSVFFDNLSKTSARPSVFRLISRELSELCYELQEDCDNLFECNVQFIDNTSSQVEADTFFCSQNILAYKLIRHKNINQIFIKLSDTIWNELKK